MVLIFIFILQIIMLKRIHEKRYLDSFNYLDILFSWIIITTIYTTIIIIITPNSLNNLLFTLTKYDIKTTIVTIILLILYILSLILIIPYSINHIKRIKSYKQKTLITLTKHFLIGAFSIFIIPMYYILTFKDYNFNTKDKTLYNVPNIDISKIKTSYTDSLGNTIFKDENGNIIMESLTELSGNTTIKDKNGKVIGTGYIDSLGYSSTRDLNGKEIISSYTDSLGNTIINTEGESYESYTDSLGFTDYKKNKKH